MSLRGRLIQDEVLFWCSKGLLWRHGSSFGPCGGEGFLSKLGARSSDRALIVCTEDRWQREADHVAQGFSCPPEPCRPYYLSLCRDHGRQFFQAEGGKPFVV